MAGKWTFWLVLAGAFLLLCPMATAAANVLPANLEGYAPPSLFNRLPEMVDPVRGVISSFVILFFAASMVSGFSKSAEEIPTLLTSLALIAFFAFSTPQLLQLGLTVVEQTTEEVGYTNFATANKIWSGYEVVSQVPIFPTSVEEDPDNEDTGFMGWAKNVFGGARDVLDGAASLGNMLLVLPRTLLAATLMPFIAVCWGIGSIIMVAMESIRYFIIYLGSILLPLAIGALAVPSLRSMGMQYILSIIGVLSWPLGWMMANIGTFALADTIFKVLTAEFITEMHPDRVAEFQAAMIQLQTGPALNLNNPIDAAVFDGVSALTLTAGSLITLALLTLGLLCWMLLGAIGGAFAISRTFTTGAGFAAPMVGGALQGMAKAAGSALSIGAMMSARGAAGRGESAGMGTKAAFAAGKTLTNLSRSSGDSSSLTQVPDSAINERLNATSQMAEKATTRMMAKQYGGGGGGAGARGGAKGAAQPSK